MYFSYNLFTETILTEKVKTLLGAKYAITINNYINFSSFFHEISEINGRVT